jgi:UDP-N-acetyl-D-mannosaminuronate dehydrogenase
MGMIESLKNKITDKSARLCIIGMGYVGLPTAVFFAEKGFNVAGYDVRKTLLRR